MEAILSLAIGVILPPIVNLLEQQAKKLGFKVQSAHMLLLIACIIGLGYTTYSYFVPELLREQVFMFSSSSIGTAVLVYEFLLKSSDGVDS